MITQKIYILWHSTEGYRTDKVYLDRESAEIGLSEHFTEYCILNKTVKIEEINAVSYKDISKLSSARYDDLSRTKEGEY